MIKIAVIGTGGVGGYFGGRLVKAGNEVIFIARGEHMRAMKENGLHVKSIKGDFVVHPLNVTDQIGEIEAPDLVILTMKAWQVKDMAHKLKTIIKPETIVLPLQNGVLASDELISVLNPGNVIGGSCRIFSKIEAPGVINHYGIEPTIIFGELDHTKTDRLQNIKNIFDDSGIVSKISDDIHTELWMKLMVICVGGLLAITRSPYGAVREQNETRNLMRELLQEIYLVSQKAGVNIEQTYVDQTMAYIDMYPYDSTTSLARDIWDGKPSEIEYQNGTIVALGAKYGVATPVNQFVYYCLLPMETKARKK